MSPVAAVRDHPAPYSEAVLDVIEQLCHEERVRLGHDPRILDPFAGVGRIHHLNRRFGWDTVGVELEPEWAACHKRTQVGDATRLDADWSGTFDIVATSPVFGNRMSDHHDARDASKRITYRHKLGRALSENNAGAMQWGAAYQALHQSAWNEAYRVLKAGGLVLVNISNHVRSHAEVAVAEWHIGALAEAGFRLRKVRDVATPRMGFGENRDVRVPVEFVIVMRKP